MLLTNEIFYNGSIRYFLSELTSSFIFLPKPSIRTSYSLAFIKCLSIRVTFGRLRTESFNVVPLPLLLSRSYNLFNDPLPFQLLPSTPYPDEGLNLYLVGHLIHEPKLQSNCETNLQNLET